MHAMGIRANGPDEGQGCNCSVLLVGASFTATVVAASSALADSNSEESSAVSWAIDEMKSDPTAYYDECL